MEDFKFYEVGGKIRDELLGLKSKDVDYVAVLLDYLHSEKFEVFLVTEDCYTC